MSRVGMGSAPRGGSVPQPARGPAGTCPGAPGSIPSPTTRPWSNSPPSRGSQRCRAEGAQGSQERACGFSPACLRARVAPGSRNRLSALQTGFNHNPECITEKSNNKYILLLNSWAPSASDLPDGPWQPGRSGKGWRAFLQPLCVRGANPVHAQPPGVAEGFPAGLHAG